MNKTFNENTRRLALRSTSGYCSYDGCNNRATEFHHKMPNTKTNQKIYPLFLQSIFNCFPICNDCHMSKPKIKISYALANSYEEWLNDYINNSR